MSIQRVLAGVCAVAGVALLAGPGWALLVAALLLFLAPEPKRIRSAVGRCREALASTGTWLMSGRRSVAAATMPVAFVAVGAGVLLMAGVGAALLAAGVVLGGLSLHLGWNT